MPRKKSHKAQSKRARSAALCYQEAPEQRANRLEKLRIREAMRRSSESVEVREARLARNRARVSATRKSLKERAKCFSLKLGVNQDLTSASFDSYSNTLRGRDLSDFKAYLLYNEQLKRAASNAAIRRSLETPEQRSLRLERNRTRAAAIRACEPMEKRAVRQFHQRMHSRENRLQAKMQKQHLIEPVPNRIQNISKVRQEEPIRPPFSVGAGQPKIINGFCPRYRGGLCPKSAGNYDLMTDNFNVECDVLLEGKQERSTEGNSDHVRSIVENTSQLRHPKKIATKNHENGHFSTGNRIL